MNPAHSPLSPSKGKKTCASHVQGIIKTLAWPALVLLSALHAQAQALHPLGTALPDAELQFVVRDVARAGKSVLVQAIYQPYREADVHTSRNFHLLDILPWRSGSRDLMTVSREDSHRVEITAVAQPVPATDAQARATQTSIRFTVPLRDPNPAYGGFQLVRVQVGTLEFGRWFAEAPMLDPAFDISTTASSLQGTARMGAMGAAPLGGALPLWPGLRTIDVVDNPASQPTLDLWDASKNAEPTDWHIVPARNAPGVAYDIYWPQGDSLLLPRVRFDLPSDVIALPVAHLTPRAQALLVRSISARPGTESSALTAAEWNELDALATAEEEPDPVALKVEQAALGRTFFDLTLSRRKFTEPWLYLFGAEYDNRRHVSITGMVLHPTPWKVP